MTLTEFLTARLDEKEASADDFHDARRCDSLDRDGGFESDRCDCGHPARVLREVDADRKLIAAYRFVQEKYDSKVTTRDLAEDRWLAGEMFGLQFALMVRAERFSGHPDYDEAWRP